MLRWQTMLVNKWIKYYFIQTYIYTSPKKYQNTTALHLVQVSLELLTDQRKLTLNPKRLPLFGLQSALNRVGLFTVGFQYSRGLSPVRSASD
jgi:hypothetical protein